ncbi:MAG: SGNH/GDSL hydrolase family protein [Opitutae bacterium]|nr:SGNH/GDSL hydrolase family protein [Opitutae bacterium]
MKEGNKAENLLLRVVAITDSLALPRDEDGTCVVFDKTWPYLLSEILRVGYRAKSEVICNGKRALTADQIVSPHFFKYNISLYRPSVLVIQVGIVDCSPRIFSRREKGVISSPFFPTRIRKKLIAHRSVRRRQILLKDPLAKVYTKPKEFEEAMISLRTKIEDLPFLAIPIVLPIVIHEKLDVKSPGIRSNVNEYNRILNHIWENFVSSSSLLDEGQRSNCFADDGYHLSVEGNRMVAESLGKVIRELLVDVTVHRVVS